MNYQQIHDSLIAHARTFPPQGYSETHHVLPRCMGGDDSPTNLVVLSTRQHFVIHWLLTKIHPENAALRYAFHMMFYPTSTGTRQSDFVWSRSRAYAYNKERMAEATRERFAGVPKSESQRGKMSASASERWSNTDERAKQSERLRGNQNSVGLIKGPLSDETKQKISDAQRANWTTRPHPRKGTRHTEQTIAKIKATKAANPHVYTDEQRRKISERLTGHPPSELQRTAAREANSATWEVIHPDGRTEVLVNLRAFCKEHKLSQGNLSMHGHTKGYRARKLD